MNHIFLMGRLTKDTELNQSGKIATNNLAVDRCLKDANGNKVTDFIPIRWLGETKAQFAWKYLPKGTKIMIEGSLCIDQYKDPDGNPKSACYVIVDNTEFAQGKKTDAPATDANGFASMPDGEKPPFD